MQLKQGAGRLLRRESDRGPLQFLDREYKNGHYYRLVKKALPPHTELESVSELKPGLQFTGAYFRLGFKPEVERV